MKTGFIPRKVVTVTTTTRYEVHFTEEQIFELLKTQVKFPKDARISFDLNYQSFEGITLSCETVIQKETEELKE